ncbi:hypothetical protein KUTeg_000028 [Tegillarca granosa]|uniref:Uncharacterized protein n=1 Tax=Tegillarca granosa TaxID=220873 RepID=A0ABQ9FYV7_TEGGR|nr:hypothetical protein KUTeg_000028 [Tegillarca granosa]
MTTLNDRNLIVFVNDYRSAIFILLLLFPLYHLSMNIHRSELKWRKLDIMFTKLDSSQESLYNKLYFVTFFYSFDFRKF